MGVSTGDETPQTYLPLALKALEIHIPILAIHRRVRPRRGRALSALGVARRGRYPGAARVRVGRPGHMHCTSKPRSASKHTEIMRKQADLHYTWHAT